MATAHHAANAPTAKPRPFHIGRGFAPFGPDGRRLMGAPCNKLTRRMLRRDATRQQSNIERAIVEARRIRLEAQSLATNSHEAKRYVQADRLERTTR